MIVSPGGRLRLHREEDKWRRFGLNSTRKAWSRVMHLDTPLPWSKGSLGFRDLNVGRSWEKLEYL
jgi:hypothetical protein